MSVIIVFCTAEFLNKSEENGAKKSLLIYFASSNPLLTLSTHTVHKISSFICKSVKYTFGIKSRTFQNKMSLSTTNIFSGYSHHLTT